MKTKTPEPFPRSLRLSAKEAGADLSATFATWVKLGELPETALLARFVGSGACFNLGSYVNESTGARMGKEVNEMETLCYLTVTGKLDRWYMIFAPAQTT